MNEYDIPLAEWQSAVKTAGSNSKERQYHSQKVLPKYSLIQKTERRIRTLELEKAATKQKLEEIQSK